VAIYRREGSKKYRYDFTIDGVRYRGSTETSKKTEALEKEAALMVSIREKGELRKPKKAPTLKEFAAWFFEWVEKSNRLKPKTKECYALGWRP
jgi:hypothetical protein